jgi:hypothetical protein|tara:strand:- start:365 stop:535 length:171 start_codon:yes stop_codon:yes gene_type:complete
MVASLGFSRREMTFIENPSSTNHKTVFGDYLHQENGSEWQRVSIWGNSRIALTYWE